MVATILIAARTSYGPLATTSGTRSRTGRENRLSARAAWADPGTMPPASFSLLFEDYVLKPQHRLAPGAPAPLIYGSHQPPADGGLGGPRRLFAAGTPAPRDDHHDSTRTSLRAPARRIMSADGEASRPTRPSRSTRIHPIRPWHRPRTVVRSPTTTRWPIGFGRPGPDQVVMTMPGGDPAGRRAPPGSTLRPGAASAHQSRQPGAVRT